MSPNLTERQLTIGGLISPGMDQCDFTGPFTVLSRVPNSRFLTLWKNLEPVTDLNGLRLLPDTTLQEAPQLDVLLVPGKRPGSPDDGRGAAVLYSTACGGG
jgi:cyclohexyl-isocyanide hydratase